MSAPHTTNPSLRNKVNFRKGWPNHSIVEDVRHPIAEFVAEAGMIVRRSGALWAPGVNTLHEEAFILRNDGLSPDAARGEHVSGYKQVPFGGLQGISLQNPLEIELVHFVEADAPAVGDLFHSPVAGDHRGKLRVCQRANGTVVVNEVAALLYCVAPKFFISDTPYIVVAPVAQRIMTPPA